MPSIEGTSSDKELISRRIVMCLQCACPPKGISAMYWRLRENVQQLQGQTVHLVRIICWSEWRHKEASRSHTIEM